MITPSFAITATERVLPKLALDFTTASLDSRVTFTRTTGASNPASYVDSNGSITAATNNQPRFDYDPSTLTCKGLLIEESRSNLCTYSQSIITSTGWSSSTTTLTGSQASPNNSTNATLITEIAATSSHRCTGTSFVTVNGSTYTVTIYAKYYDLRYLVFGLEASATQYVVYGFNLQSGALSGQTYLTGYTNTSASITNAGNGWYRCSITATVNSIATYMTIGLSDTATWVSSARGYPSYAGSTTKGVSVFGAQVELGAFATSYIPTTTTALTRNADVATMTGTNFSDWYVSGAGGIVSRALPITVSGIRPLVQFDDGISVGIIALRGNTTNPELYIKNVTDQSQIDAGTIAANSAYGLGGTWVTDNCAASVNGNAAVTDASATIPTVTQARLGSDGTNYLNGQLQSVRYWPQRITNAEIQAFSK